METKAQLTRQIGVHHNKQIKAGKKAVDSALVTLNSLTSEKNLIGELLKTLPNRATKEQAVIILRKVSADAYETDDPEFAAEIRTGMHDSSFEALRHNIQIALDEKNLVL